MAGALNKMRLLFSLFEKERKLILLHIFKLFVLPLWLCRRHQSRPAQPRGSAPGHYGRIVRK